MHLVVVKGASHVLAGNTLHEYHLLVGLHDLYDLRRATRDLLFATGPAQKDLWCVPVCDARNYYTSSLKIAELELTCTGE